MFFILTNYKPPVITNLTISTKACAPIADNILTFLIIIENGSPKIIDNVITDPNLIDPLKCDNTCGITITI